MKNDLYITILKDINYNYSEANIKLLKDILSKSQNNIEYVWSKMNTLIKKISHLKGFLGISNSELLIKISFDSDNVSQEFKDEFYDIVNAWSKKYKVILSYNYEKETFYLR